MQKITTIMCLLLLAATSLAWGITQHPTYPATIIGDTVNYYTNIQNKGIGAKDLTVTVSFNTEIATTDQESYLILPGEEQTVWIHITPQVEENQIIQAIYAGRTEGNIETRYIINIPLIVSGEAILQDPCSGISCPDYCSNGILYKDGICYAGVCVYSTSTCSTGGSGSSIYYPPIDTTTEQDIEQDTYYETTPPTELTISSIERPEPEENMTEEITLNQQQTVNTIVGQDTVIPIQDERETSLIFPLVLAGLALLAIGIALSPEGRDFFITRIDDLKEKIQEVRQ